MSGAGPMVEFEAQVQRVLPLSVLLRIGDLDVWLPRSDIALDPPAGLGQVRVTLPVWLADDRGLTASAAPGQGALF